MKRIRLIFGVLLSTLLPLQAQVLYQSALKSAADLQGFSRDSAVTVDTTGLAFSLSQRTSYKTIVRSFDPAKFSNRLIRISCEVRGENILQKKKTFDGIKFMFSMQGAKRKAWGEIAFPDGSFDWRKFETVIAVPDKLKSINLSIGMQNSAGKFQMRNIKVESIGIPVQIRSAANMGLKDEKAGDGKGGWTDQGRRQDGWCFFGHLFRKNFSGIPFDVEPEGKGVLTLYSKHFENGPRQVEIPVETAEKAKAFYLLHTLAWGPELRNKKAGVITLRDKNGKEQKIEVLYNRDVADWYRNIAVLTNGYAALRGRAGDGEVAGIYASRFVINSEMAEISSVRFESNPECIWLILGATLSPKDIPLPSSKTCKIKANDQWLPLTRPAENRIQPGSALDLSAYQIPGTVDELGRIIIRNGHFCYEKKPDQRVRFLTNAMHPDQSIPKTHADIERFAAEIRRNGYNMVRTHFLDTALMTGMKKPCEFNPAMLDRIDYFIFCMKKNGIYLNFDCMTSWIGYTPGNIHKNNDPVKSFKSLIYFVPEVRKNWSEGVRKFLCRVNPYTKTRLIDDPVLAMAVAYNEQEFGIWRDFDKRLFQPQWNEFLKKKYGTIGKLHKAWGKSSENFKNFESIPCVKGNSGNYSNTDAAEFLYTIDSELLHWFEKEMRAMGFKGYLTAYNAGKSHYYNYLRKDLPFVGMNHYFAHPSNWISKHSFINQRSAIGEKAITLRNFISTRQPGKPFVITEQNFVFWNQFRYEQGFVIGGYSAFQDFDVLTCHASPVSFHMVRDIQSFGIWGDPIAKASEFLTYFLFIREDVKAAKPVIRIRSTRKDVFSATGFSGSLSSEQSLPALIVGESVECTENAAAQKALRPGEIAYKLGATSSVVVNNAGFSGSEDNPVANMAELLMHLRKADAISSKNKSDGKQRFESGTEELFLDSSRNYMQIVTPRLQGVCAQAGTKAVLPDFEVLKMSQNGNLAIVSIDGKKPLNESRRMVLVYATDVLNSDMEFSDASKITLLSNGHGPSLLRRGAFMISVRNENAATMKLYPLDLAGKRLKEIRADKVEDGKAYFSVDTGKDGASIFFEITQ